MAIATGGLRRVTAAAVVVGLTAISGCTRLPEHEPVAHDTAQQTPTQRARHVAAAWDGSAAAAAWRAGYHPRGAVTQPPQGGWHSAADESAYRDRDLVLGGMLPATGPKHGRVAWADDVTLRRPLRAATAAYQALTRGHHPGGPHLTVTGARLGEMSVVTSRGPAVVPAWLFRLEGYDAPLKRAAAVPSALPRSPIGRMSGSTTIEGLVGVDGWSVTVAFSHGVCDKGFDMAAYETRGSVVLSILVRKPMEHGICTKQAKGELATLQLAHPLDDRVLLDALTGKPPRYRPEYGRWLGEP
jgi:hypothetical protein